MKRFLLMVVCGLALAVLAGCGPKTNLVPLEYLPLGQPESLCSQPIAVGAFIDRRTHDDIGRDKTFVLYPAGGTVEQWVANALDQELSVRGCEVSRENQDSPFTPSVVVKGDVVKVSAIRDGFDYSTELELVVKVFREGEPVFQKVYRGQWQRTFVTPSDTRFRDLLRQALQDLLRDVVHDLKPMLSTI